MKWTMLPLWLMLLCALPLRAQGTCECSPREFGDIVECTDVLGYLAIPGFDCNLMLLNGDVLVVRTRAQWLGVLEGAARSCKGPLPLEIDFERYSLIGRMMQTANAPGGHFLQVHICRDDSARAYRHTVVLGPGGSGVVHRMS